MPTPSIDPTLLDHISDAAYWEAWDRYAQTALQSLLTFHGACDGNAPTAAADHAAECATEMMRRRIELIIELEEARAARREEEKAQKAAGKGKR